MTTLCARLQKSKMDDNFVFDGATMDSSIVISDSDTSESLVKDFGETMSEKISVKKEPVIEYYIDNNCLLLLHKGIIEYTVPDLMSTLLYLSSIHDKVCKAVPVGVAHNCRFLIGLEFIKSINDLRADDGVVWGSEKELGHYKPVR